VGSGGVTGHIITGGNCVDIRGNASANVRVIYAPNALVTIHGSGHVRGAVVANSCTMTGGASLIYDANAHLGEIPGVIGGGNEPGGGEPGTGVPVGGGPGGPGGTGGGPGGSGPGGGATGGEVDIDIGQLIELDYQ